MKNKIEEYKKRMDELYKIIEEKDGEWLEECQNDTDNGKRFLYGFKNIAKEERKALAAISRELRIIQRYTLRELPDYGDHMTMEEFIGHCKCGGFIDYDGYGNYATEDECSDIEINPSDIMSGEYRKDFTHVMWYNK